MFILQRSVCIDKTEGEGVLFFCRSGVFAYRMKKKNIALLGKGEMKMKKKMGVVLCAICMMTALFSFGIVYAADEGTESPQEPAVVETYADPGEKTVVVGNQKDLHNAIEKANARGAEAIAAGEEMEPMTIKLTSDIRFDSSNQVSSNQANVFELTAGSNVRIEGHG